MNASLNLVVGLIFLVAGFAKYTSMHDTVNLLRSVYFVSDSVAELLARYVSVLEVVVGLGFFIRPLRQGAASLAIILSMCFIATLLVVLINGWQIDCGCFGSVFSLPVHVMLAIDISILLGSIVIWRRSRNCLVIEENKKWRSVVT